MELVDYIFEIDHLSKNYLMSDYVTVLDNNEVVSTDNGNTLFIHGNGVFDILYSSNWCVLIVDDMRQLVMYHRESASCAYSSNEIVIENISELKKINGIYGPVWYIKNDDSKELLIYTNYNSTSRAYNAGIRIYVLNESTIKRIKFANYVDIHIDEDCLDKIIDGIVLDFARLSVKILVDNKIYDMDIIGGTVGLKNMTMYKLDIEGKNYVSHGHILCYNNNMVKYFMPAIFHERLHAKFEHDLEDGNIKNIFMPSCHVKTVLAITNKNIILSNENPGSTLKIGFDNLCCEMMVCYYGRDTKIYYFENDELCLMKFDLGTCIGVEYDKTRINQNMIKKRSSTIRAKSAKSMV